MFPKLSTDGKSLAFPLEDFPPSRPPPPTQQTTRPKTLTPPDHPLLTTWGAPEVSAKFLRLQPALLPHRAAGHWESRKQRDRWRELKWGRNGKMKGWTFLFSSFDFFKETFFNILGSNIRSGGLLHGFLVHNH